MVSLVPVISRTYHHTCIKIVLGVQRRANLLLFLLGICLITVGMERLSASQQAEPDTPKKTAEGATGVIKKEELTKGTPETLTQGQNEAFTASSFEARTPGILSEAAVNRLAEGASPLLSEPGVAQRQGENAIPTAAELGLNTPAEPADVPYDDTLVRNSVGNLFKLIEGAFGALLVVGAGIGAIVAATMGAYKAALALLVVSVGAFVLRAYVSLFFGTNYPDYEVGNF